MFLPAQKLDIGTEGNLARALAEVFVLQHLEPWEGAVRLLGYEKKDEQAGGGRKRHGTSSHLFSLIVRSSLLCRCC